MGNTQKGGESMKSVFHTKADPIRMPKTPFSHNTRLIVPQPAVKADSRIGKVLHAPADSAGQMSTQAIALKRLGLPVSFCSYSLTNRYGYPTDLASPLKDYHSSQKDYLTMRFAIDAAKVFDLFHFHAGQSLTLFHYTDLPYLSLFGKKMVMTYWGSEIRKLSVAKKHNPYARARIVDEKEIHQRLLVISRYMDAVIAPDYEIFEYMKGYFPKVHLIRQAVDPHRFVPAYPKPVRKPLVVHAPSDPYLKGTEYVLKAVKELQRSIPFTYVQVENMTHAEATKLYRQADIIIDQLCLGIYSILSIEGMLLGKPVITFIRDDLKETYPKGLPIVSANPDTIRSQLANLLKNPEKRLQLGLAGRNYAVAHHNPEKIARQLITVYNAVSVQSERR
jgi:glycosyltransferase involved in cell wall biosynthesis